MTLSDYRNYVQKKYKVGQVIQTKITDDERATISTAKVKIIKFYRDFVLCEGKGYMICPSYFELWRKDRKTEIKVDETVIPRSWHCKGRVAY